MTGTSGRDRGAILIAVLLVVVLVAGMCVAALLMTHTDSRNAAFEMKRTQALYVAQSAVEDVVKQLSNMRSSSRLDQPFAWYDSLTGRVLCDSLWLTKDGLSMGQYDATVTAVNQVDRWTRDVAVHAVGYIPSKTSPGAVRRSIDAVVRVSNGRSEVFDYVYFINNWGWYYGDTIVANGNVRANGQFDGGVYDSTLNAFPRYQKLDSTGHLQGYIDDGGIYSGWNIIGAQDIKGDANALWTQADVTAGHCQPADVGKKKCQHPYQDPVPMPNLSDLTPYEALAKEKSSYIKVGSTIVVNAVQGDVAGAPQNLFLRGTAANPIEIHGPVVVRGSVIISGVVKGQGAIYSGGNVYVPQDLTYVHPITATPLHATQTQMESWIAANAGADALGLFARKHVVVGDYTNSSWQSYVSSWVNDSRNESAEDAGLDNIPNTRKGRDGVLGTADDDVLEGDGVWTVDHYTAMHQTEGVIPPGKHVGDAIPGTGEDIDGDGVYTPRCQMSQFNIPASLTAANWAGNVPSGTPSFSSVSSTSITRLDGALYTNHHIAMLTLASGKDMNFNGCVVSRNESIVYATSHCIFNYDLRLLDEGQTYGFYLPHVWKAVQVVYWTAK